MNNYIISNETLAIVMLDRKSCMILEKNREFFVDLSWKEVINNSCLFYGSSYDGRVEGSRNILGKDIKLPIIISEFYELLFFPVGNYKSDIFAWLNLQNIDNYYIEDDMVEFIFKCNKRYKISISKKSLETQLLKAYDLERIYKNRCKKT